MSTGFEGITVDHIDTSATTSTDGSRINQEQNPMDPVDPVLGGYPRVAQFMNQYPPTAIFSSFKELSLTNLLRMQSELHWLEQRLNREQELDTNSDGGETHSLSFEMRQDVTVRGKLLREIDRKLERYQDALLRMTKLGEVQNLTAKDHEALRFWLGSNNYLTASERTVWDPSRSDHICLSKIKQKDIFYEMMYGIFHSFYHRLWGYRKRRTPGALVEYDDGLIETLAALLSISSSSLLPTLAILVLYFVKPPLIRIALVCIITGATSFLLSCFTKTRRMEIFSATAAFAAVMIVFVSNGTPNG